MRRYRSIRGKRGIKAVNNAVTMKQSPAATAVSEAKNKATKRNFTQTEEQRHDARMQKKAKAAEEKARSTEVESKRQSASNWLAAFVKREPAAQPSVAGSAAAHAAGGAATTRGARRRLRTWHSRPRVR